MERLRNMKKRMWGLFFFRLYSNNLIEFFYNVKVYHRPMSIPFLKY